MPNWTQLVIPAIEKLAASPKAEQTARLMQGMEGLTAGAAESPTPWQRLLQMLPKAMKGTKLKVEPAEMDESVLDFTLKHPSGGGITAQIGKGQNPYQAYLHYLKSNTTRRASVGDPGTGLEEYKLPIESPAQARFTGKGFEPIRPKEEIIAREPEAFDRPYLKAQGPSLTEKKLAFDAIARLLRESGHKELKFAAEPGERPRLYEKLTGYRPEPTNASQIDIMSNMMHGMPSRGTTPTVQESMEREAGRRLTRAEAYEQLRNPRSAPIHVTALERQLGMSAEEAEAYGLAQQAGPQLYNLTDRGRRMSQVDWFGGP